MSSVVDCAALPDHVQQSCNNYRKGGISAIAIINEDASIPAYTSASDWTTAINAGDVVIIKKIKATWPAASPVEGENPVPCGADTIFDGTDETLTWKDFNVNGSNDIFYAQLNQKQNARLAVFFCQEDEIRVVESAVNFSALYNAPESSKEKQSYTVTAKWFNEVGEYNSLFAAPAGIFTS